MKGSGFEFFPDEHTYLLDGRPMTGMTTLLGSVIAKPQLIQWAADEAVKKFGWLDPRYNDEQTRFQAIGTRFKEIEQMTFDEYSALLSEARFSHRKKKEDAATKGTDTHALVEEYINQFIKRDNQPPLTPLGEDYFKPIQPFIDWSTKENIRFLASELQVFSRDLWVAGTMDFLFEKDGKRYIGDLKTYKKLWDRVPMFQCAGYGYLYKEMHNEEVAGYVVFNIPKERAHDPEQDVRWSFDVDGDTKAFMACVELYRKLANW